jgi:hypothetical protein
MFCVVCRLTGKKEDSIFIYKGKSLCEKCFVEITKNEILMGK